MSTEEDAVKDLVSAISAHAAENPDRIALTFCEDDGGGLSATSLTYRELDHRVGAVATRLERDVTAGERALLLYMPGLDFVVGFLASLRAGVIAVPAPMPDGRAKGLDRLAAIVQDATISAVLTHSPIHEAVEAWSGSMRWDGEIVVTDRIRDDATVGTDSAQTDSGRNPVGPIAFLQYTSGSTGDPKGVVVTHANLVANQREIQRALCSGPDTVMVGWLPQFHDMGLIGMTLHPLYVGGRCVFTSPFTFLKRPVRWLRMASEYHATLSVAPNFAFDFVARKVRRDQIRDLDLSALTRILNGSEPILVESIERFTDLLAPTGLSQSSVMPVYGLAEATLFVSGGPGYSEESVTRVDPVALADNELRPAADGRSLVSCGFGHGTQIAVVDPDRAERLPEGRIGEIWLRGDSIAAGYWERPGLTDETFRAHIGGGDGPWLRTGDLGALVAGRLVVTGRIKDMIVIAGRNIYAHDIEAAARAAVPELRYGVGAAFGVGAPERLVLVHEIVSGAEADVHAVTRAVSATITREFGTSLAELRLVDKGEVDRTTSGKIRRREVRRRFLSGELAPPPVEVR